MELPLCSRAEVCSTPFHHLLDGAQRIRHYDRHVLWPKSRIRDRRRVPNRVDGELWFFVWQPIVVSRRAPDGRQWVRLQDGWANYGVAACLLSHLLHDWPGYHPESAFSVLQCLCRFSLHFQEAGSTTRLAGPHVGMFNVGWLRLSEGGGAVAFFLPGGLAAALVGDAGRGWDFLARLPPTAWAGSCSCARTECRLLPGNAFSNAPQAGECPQRDSCC
mmetsp:Transcript_61028/g.125833  ORF Transcript_61028/g.125833 Transcript_61028/m.125833 type:complete len:218 (+) Transcript_61028:498-1151(+)